MPRKKRPAPPRKWDRSWHEERAASMAASAKRDLVFTKNCDTSAVYALVRANRDIAHARTHLVAIGPGRESARTRKLWAIVSKSERMVEQATNHVAKCLLKR